MHKQVFSLLIGLAFSLVARAHGPLREDYTKVALVIAQAANQIESKFGHSFLRFSRAENFDVIEDVAVEFGADLEGNGINYFRGIGIGQSYSFDVKPSAFQTVWLSNTHVQERNLYHYELNLPPSEVKKLIRNLNEYIVGQKKINYNFFVSNCSTQVAEVLNTVLPEEIEGFSKNVPVWLPERLKERGLVRKEFTVPSIKTQREEVIDRALDEAIEGIDHPFTQNLRTQLLKDFGHRIIAYIKLIELAKLHPDRATKIKSFVKRMSTNELLETRMDVLRLSNGEFAGMYQATPLFEQKNKTPGPSLQKSLDEGKFQAEFIERKGLGHLRLIAEDNCVEQGAICARETFVLGHDKLRPASTPQFLELDKYPVAYLGVHENIQKMIQERTKIAPEIVTIKGRQVIMALVIQDFGNSNRSNLKGLGLINKTDQANPVGMCAGFAFTQRALMMNTFFRPDGSKRSQTYYNEVLQSALSGKQTFAHGVSNIEELTAKADPKLLQDFISFYNSNYNEFIRLSVEYLNTRKITQNSIAEISYMTSKGLYPLLTFQPYPEIRVEHMIVIYGVKDFGSKYQLLAYDPNIGLIPENYVVKFFIDKSDMSISSTFYKKIEKGHVPRLR